MAEGETKTTINLNSQVYAAAKARAVKLNVDFGELVEMALKRDLKERMAILRTEEKIVYAPIEEEVADGTEGYGYVDELIEYLGKFEKRCSEQRWLGAKFHVKVLQDIAADVKVLRDKLLARALEAEQSRSGTKRPTKQSKLKRIKPGSEVQQPPPSLSDESHQKEGST